MAELGFFDRLRDFLSSRRFLWIVTITFGVLVAVFFLFLTFLFNPFEDDLGDTAGIVDSQVDYFLRWRGIGGRFDEFPVPRMWTAFSATSTYSQLDSGGELAGWDSEYGVSDAVNRLRAAAGNVPAGVDLQTDLLREVAMAGRGSPSLDASFDGVLILRVSFKVKAGVALLGLGFVRDKVPESLGLRDEGSGLYVIPQFEPFGFQDAYLTRIRDTVLIASRKEWLEKARELEVQSGQGSLSQASIFSDKVEAHLSPGDQPVEVFLRWDRMGGPSFTWPEPESYLFWDKAAGHFFSTDLLRSLAGYWLPGERFEGRFSGQVDISKASPFQRSWYEGRGLEVSLLRDFAAMVPEDTFLFAAVAGNAGRVLTQLQDSLESDVQRILDEEIIGSGQYQGVAHLLQDVGEAAGPGLVFALRRNDYPPDPTLDVEHDDQPVPAFVVIARQRSSQTYQKLETYFRENVTGFLEGAKTWRTTISGGVQVLSFTSPAIPGTGEILMMEIPDLKVVLVSNSPYYLRQVVQTGIEGRGSSGRADLRSLADVPSFQESLDGLLGGPKLFFYFQPEAAAPWLDKLAIAMANERFVLMLDEFFKRERQPMEQRMALEMFGREASSLAPPEIIRLREAVDAALGERETEFRRESLPQLVAGARRGMLPLQLLEWVSASLEAGRRETQLLVSGLLALD